MLLISSQKLFLFSRYLSLCLTCWSCRKNRLIRNISLTSKFMISFNISEKGFGLVSQPHFIYDFSRKMFLMLHSINWPTFIVWFPLLFEILAQCVHSRQKLKNLENEKRFCAEMKNIFHHFKGLSVVKNCLRPDSVPLSRRSLLLQHVSPRNQEKCKI